MSEPTYRETVVSQFIARLQAITVVGGYSVDIGERLFVGEVPELGPDDPKAAVALVVGPDTIRHIGEHVTLTLPMEISAVVRGEPNASVWLRVERILGDIKRAVEGGDRRLDGLLRERIERGQTQTREREPGSQCSGVSIDYFVPMSEQWGLP